MAYTFRHGDRPLEGITIQRAVGRGGFGEVYYALSDSGKQLAIKYLRESPEIELRGISQVMNLKSPHLVAIYDVRRNADGEPFVIMEYISGPSLRDILRASPCGVGEQKAAFFVEGIGKGLSYLHERGIVHRDLKPGNIFYDDGYVKIGDYGLSKHISVSAHSGNTVSVGTVHYMAPEIGSGSYTKAIDIYALGVILYELLTGRLPFSGSSMGEVLMRHLRENPDMTGIRAPFAQIIAKALAKNPDERYQDADEMIDALMSVAGVRESISTFDPMTLTSVPRIEGVADTERTQTSPARRSGPVALDVREVPGPAARLPSVPPIPPIPGTGPAPAGAPADPAARRGIPPVPRPRAGGAAARGEMPVRRGRWAQFAVVVVLIVATAFLASLLFSRADEEHGPAVALLLAGGAFGSIFAHFQLAGRLLTPNPLLIRIAHATCAWVCMVPGILIGMDAEAAVARLAIPLLASILLSDWQKRIEAGRCGAVGGSWLWWHGLVGLVAGAFADTDVRAAAGLCIMLPIITQAAAGIWPLPVAQPVLGARRPERAADAKPATEGSVEVLEAAGRRMEQAFARLQPAGPERKAQSRRRGGTVGVSARPAAPGHAATAAVVIDACEPSFVGHTASAGLSALGKLLLLVGLALAMALQSAPERRIGLGAGASALVVREGTIAYWDGTELHAVPPAAMLAPFWAGTLLLLIARRRDGAAHVLRALFAGALSVTVASLATRQSSVPLRHLFEDELIKGQLRYLVSLAIITIGALVLLFWPRRRIGSSVVHV